MDNNFIRNVKKKKNKDTYIVGALERLDPLETNTDSNTEMNIEKEKCVRKGRKINSNKKRKKKKEKKIIDEITLTLISSYDNCN